MSEKMFIQLHKSGKIVNPRLRAGMFGHLQMTEFIINNTKLTHGPKQFGLHEVRSTSDGSVTFRDVDCPDISFTLHAKRIDHNKRMYHFIGTGTGRLDVFVDNKAYRTNPNIRAGAVVRISFNTPDESGCFMNTVIIRHSHKTDDDFYEVDGIYVNPESKDLGQIKIRIYQGDADFIDVSEAEVTLLTSTGSSKVMRCNIDDIEFDKYTLVSSSSFRDELSLMI